MYMWFNLLKGCMVMKAKLEFHTGLINLLPQLSREGYLPSPYPALGFRIIPLLLERASYAFSAHTVM